MRELVQVGARADALISDVARGYGVSHAALNALAVIEAADAPLPAGEITAAMHISTATMTRVLDTLERKDLVRRQADPGDRRRVLLGITPAGVALLDQLLPAVQQAVTSTMSSLDDAELQRLLDALRVAADAFTAPPAEPGSPAVRRTHRSRPRSS
jgi:DNA-binding MarR family transcriptional regulator